MDSSSARAVHPELELSHAQLISADGVCHSLMVSKLRIVEPGEKAPVTSTPADTSG